LGLEALEVLVQHPPELELALLQGLIQFFRQLLLLAGAVVLVLTIPLEMAVQVEAVQEMSTQLREQEMQVRTHHQKVPMVEIQPMLPIQVEAVAVEQLLLELRLVAARQPEVLVVAELQTQLQVHR
jgi:hypothetical protein